MPDRAKKKQMKRLKREEKRTRHHKLTNLSPFKKVEMFSDVSACYVNEDWRERGQAIGYVVREMRDGSLAITSFLIDLWCAGLKDIWAKFDLYADEVSSSVKRTSERMNATMVRVSVDEIRQLLAGSIRFARQNGFRLPADWQKCMSFVGRLEDVDQAPLDGFGWEGDPSKLYWVAPLHDLRNRLIGCTPAEFLARPNVEYTLEVGSTGDYDDGDYGDKPADRDDKVDAYRDRVDHVTDTGARLASDWLSQKGELPHRRLRDAVALQFCRTVLPAPSDSKEMTPLQVAALELMASALWKDRIPDDGAVPEDVLVAAEQFTRWIASFANPNDSLRAIFEAMNSESRFELPSPA